MKFKVVEQHHSIKLQAHGRNLEEAFANIALALSALMVKKIEDSKEKNIAVGAQDLKGLLYIFLEEILFLAETEEFFVSNIQNLTIKKGKGYTLHAILFGDTKKESYEFLQQVKAITYNEMEIQEERGKAMVQVVVEI